MKKNHIANSLVIAAAMVCAGTANANQLISDNFDYSTGNLHNQGGWVQYGTKSESPVQVVSGPLTFSGYQDNAVGNAVKLSGFNNAGDQTLWKAFSDPVLSGAVYYAALVNIEQVSGTNYFLSFAAENYKGFGDTNSGSNYGRVFAAPGSTEGTFKFGISKSKSTPTDLTEQEYSCGETYLVVAKWELVDGNSNDILSLYINPVSSASEPTAMLTTTTGSDFTASRGVTAVTLSQAGSSLNAAPVVKVDAVRATDSWADIWTQQGGGDTPVDPVDASISVDVNDLPFYSFVGYTLKYPVTVRATGLKSDINVTLPESGEYTTDVTVIPAAAAMSATGYQLMVSYTPVAASNELPAIIRLSSEGAEDIDIRFTGTAEECATIARVPHIYNQKPNTYETFRFTGKVKVTMVDRPNSKLYAEDVFGALMIDCSALEEIPFEVGDEITDMFFTISTLGKLTYLEPMIPDVGRLLSKNNTITPTDLTLSEFMQTPDYYIYRLISIVDGTFADAEGKTFSTSPLTLAAGDASTQVKPFAGTDLIGTEVPTARTTVTGIITTVTGTISPRSKNDIVVGTTFIVTPEQLFDGEAAPINQSTVVGRYRVVTDNLTRPAMVYLTGKNRDMYSIDVEEIPAGTGETIVTLTYTPTAIGIHDGRVTFDVTPTELSTGNAFSFAAYDPDNMPLITVDSSALTPFVAAAGETVSQVITVNTANFIDYGKARVMGDANGAFTINNNMLLKSGQTAITITFRPQAEGQFTDRIELSSMMAEPVIITLSGATDGSLIKPEETEGDPLVLDDSNPLSLLNETFDGQTRNKPLKLEGWVNNAAEGKRAWWGFSFTEGEDMGNNVAKVTAYDSKIESGMGTPAQMLLITPALNGANAASKMLTFRVMGDNLLSGMTDCLDVLYIEKDGESMYTETLQGLNIPVTADYNNQWVDYVIDFEGQNIADVFFIGFRFNSTRGCDNSAIYYIDDVTYGRTDVPHIKVDNQIVEITVAQDNRHLHTATITGHNLSEPIALAMGGSNPSNFTLSTEQLPAEGGNVDIEFTSSNIGVHEAYLEMKSAGAPTGYILFAVNVVEGSGITVIPTDADGLFHVYNLSGVKVMTAGHPDMLRTLPAGVYIVNGTKYLVK